ncbi:unnamed protein product [Prorocentrum cordatum]|uniref:Protein S-acyltransferase n=1 Tax=Prorocentrum cordatum TaxID=2364126 RepID=A0ABN9W4T4_9DINO|nr:unnamed protein product [Polarella glacialis]
MRFWGARDWFWDVALEHEGSNRSPQAALPRVPRRSSSSAGPPIFARNSLYDRANAIFHLPVVAQEVLQALLWPHVEAEEGGATCGAANRGLSLAVTFVVVGLPLYSALLAKFTQTAVIRLLDARAAEQLERGACPTGHPLAPFWTDVPHYYCSVCGREELPLDHPMRGCRRCDFDACGACCEAAAARAAAGPRPRREPAWVRLLLGPRPQPWVPQVTHALRRTTSRLIFVTGWLLVIAMLGMHRRIFGDPGLEPEGGILAGPRCTTRGPHGHQVWPMMVHGRGWMRMGVGLVYMAFGGGFAFIPKPSYMPFALSILAWTVMALYWLLGDEWGSVWCWLASCLCAVILWSLTSCSASASSTPR